MNHDNYDNGARDGLNPLLPHNNRMHSSAALKMTGIWTKTIGYDPYAKEGDRKRDEEAAAASRERAKDIMALATLSNRGNEARGACKKCGMMGHLTFQCRNFQWELEPKNESSSSDESNSNNRKRRRHDRSPESKKKPKKHSTEKKKKSKKSKKSKKKIKN